MPTATDKSQFNRILFRKYARLFDSPIEGERYAALNMALKQCAEHKPPLLFFEAAALALGSNPKEHDALLEKVGTLQRERDDLAQRLQQRESEASELAEQVMAARKAIDQLIATANRKADRGSHSFSALLADLWTMPQIRLLLLMVIIMSRIVVCWRFEVDPDPNVFWFANLASGGWALVVFAKWTSLQYAQDGPLQLLIKWSIFGGGALTSFYLLLDRWPWESWTTINSMPGSHFDNPVGALIVLAVASVLTISRVSEWVVDDLGARLWDSGPMQTVRGCF